MDYSTLTKAELVHALCDAETAAARAVDISNDAECDAFEKRITARRAARDDAARKLNSKRGKDQAAAGHCQPGLTAGHAALQENHWGLDHGGGHVWTSEEMRQAVEDEIAAGGMLPSRQQQAKLAAKIRASAERWAADMTEATSRALRQGLGSIVPFSACLVLSCVVQFTCQARLYSTCAVLFKCHA